MLTVSLKEFKQKAKIFLSQSQKNNEPFFVKTRSESFVVMGKREYDSLMETLHLLRSEANAKWLQESLRQADNKQFIPFEQVYERFGADAKRP